LRPATLPESFARQRNRDPDAIAVDAADGTVSYRELDELSDQLAGRLAAAGVGPDVLVGICADRGVQLVTGLLAIMKAGGAYVPLDPAYPPDRLAFMLADANPRVVLTQGALREHLPVADGTRVVEFGSDGEVAAPHGPESANNLAYVMYTSGTTGRPKGVAVTHRGVLRLVDEPDYVDLSPQETVLQYAPISFDASTFEIWGALVNGSRLVVAPPNVRSFDELGDLIRATGVTTLWLTAPLFHLMVEQRLDSLRDVRQLLAGGDVVSPTHVADALAACDELTVINGYGPTETTTFACCHPMSGEIDVRKPLPIGRPISHTTVHVLDADLTRVPTGVEGELFIAGAGLARGYLNQPGMTAERFLPDPFSRRAGARMYRTGDLARVRADGTVEFLGRADRQVKIRGFRVEPAEVEAVLGAHENVGQCVVTPWDRGGGERVLVAHVVPRQRVSDHDLREFLSSRVPDHLVPARFVIAAGLPLDANGKIDRAALPPPTWVSENGFVEPATALERLVADTWCEVLRLERVGAEDRFLELGGDSLTGAKIVARMRQALGLGLSVDAVLEAATVRELSAAIENRMLLALGEKGQEEGRQ
jgi:amino acid adenylation domain-containing protein